MKKKKINILLFSSLKKGGGGGGGADGIQCEMDYIGETERSLKARVDNHRRSSSSSSKV